MAVPLGSENDGTIQPATTALTADGVAAAPLEAVDAAPPRRLLARLLKILAALLAVGVAALVALGLLGGAYRAEAVPGPSEALRGLQPDPKRLDRAAGKLKAAGPHGFYVVVDTYLNRLRVFKDGKPAHQAVCSTGSGVVLRDPRDGHQWVFDTPQGERQVERKVKHPIWAKPDWAFVEDGYLPPPSGSPDRFDDFSLGNYALYMADGYIIHGTVFPNLLGQRVTHGCIRLGDDDIEWMYRNVPVGAKVYMY